MHFRPGLVRFGDGPTQFRTGRVQFGNGLAQFRNALASFKIGRVGLKNGLAFVPEPAMVVVADCAHCAVLNPAVSSGAGIALCFGGLLLSRKNPVSIIRCQLSPGAGAAFAAMVPVRQNPEKQGQSARE